MEGLLIRKLEAKDAEDIVKIQKKIAKKASIIDYHKAIEEEAKKEDRIALVAELEGKIVGYMITYIIYAGFGLEKSAWIGFFGVEPEHMGSGIGKKMAHEIFKALRRADIKNIFTSVRWDSTDLLSFFKSLGFDRCDFLNLEKKLD